MENKLYQKPLIFLDKIKTIRYGNKILIGIDVALIELVNSDKIEFQSVIQDGKYVLIGPALLEGVKNQPKPKEAYTIVKAI